ncbi:MULTISPECIES: lasso peptide biosynthesis B2 protein [Burkholderia]|uniref:lasso peptide biosynthesis B2 protein n=1 Tax=Burkholderia TaxID=32008 RepID=UPI000841A5E4|nr:MULTISPECIES: lasso peptide biosynthesis B2 protein [unclassified Burkholderia]AOK31580.1 hypothetical protein AQ611_18680 [Burkholderia sp. Bp7605]
MNDNTRFVWFEDQLISLDMTGDIYTVFSEAQSRELKRRVDAILARENDQSGAAADDNVGLPIHRSAFEAISNGARRTYSGVSLNCWTILRRDVSFSNGLVVARALATLHAVHRCANTERMIGLTRMIERARQARRPRAALRVDVLIRSLNAACMLYPKKTKCLEWATTLVLLGFRYGHDLRLVVGVQNHPFYAHAWAELDREVVGDEPTLRDQLAVILETG